jgi:CMP/dCMP kinase
MIITIDGPAGAGKSTVARGLAARLQFEYLDTGSMYRAVALAGLRVGISIDDATAWAELAEKLDIVIDQGRTFLDGEDVTEIVRRADVTASTWCAADNPEVRRRMVVLQRRFADQQAEQNRSIVTEGRDQGSAVFPDAELRIFLTATPEERARRRLIDFEEQGDATSLSTLIKEINTRDARDAAREVGPLREPDGGVRVVTDGMSLEQVVSHLELLARKHDESTDLKKLMTFETFDHTADIGLRIQAASLAELLVEAAHGLTSVICEKHESIRPLRTKEWSIDFDPNEHEDLLFDWLCEILYAFDAEHELLNDFQVSLEGNKLIGSARGEKIDVDRHVIDMDVKAITYHGLLVKQELDGAWTAEVILDL